MRLPASEKIEIIHLVEQSHLPRPSNRRAPGGGQVIALVGIDGCGKTIVNSQVGARLDREVDVMPLYFGTGGGRRSLLLRPFKLMLPLATRLLKITRQGIERSPEPALQSVAHGLGHSRGVGKAQQDLGRPPGSETRTCRHQRPLPARPDLHFNDGPLLTRLAWTLGWLRRREARVYAMAERPPGILLSS
jgi:hypothetical protein